jgi:hypothetical protein
MWAALPGRLKSAKPLAKKIYTLNKFCTRTVVPWKKSDLELVFLTLLRTLRWEFPPGYFEDWWREYGVKLTSADISGVPEFLKEVKRASVLEGLKIGKVMIPGGYKKLTEPLQSFLADQELNCDMYSKNVFIMTRFERGNKILERLDKTIRETLKSNGLVGHRADDRIYPEDRNLWDNVCTYMIGCSCGIAVLEDIIRDEFNPNVALEYGFMRALGKPTLLLKEERMSPRADILGTVWEPFDVFDIEISIADAIRRWCRDIRHPEIND